MVFDPVEVTINVFFECKIRHSFSVYSINDIDISLMLKVDFIFTLMVWTEEKGLVKASDDSVIVGAVKYEVCSCFEYNIAFIDL